MADDFDVIYEVDGGEEDVGHVESAFVSYVPDPVVIKGAGNITVYAVLRCKLRLLGFQIDSLLRNKASHSKSADKFVAVHCLMLYRELDNCEYRPM